MSFDSTVVTPFNLCRANSPVVHGSTTEETLSFLLIGRGKGQLTPAVTSSGLGSTGEGAQGGVLIAAVVLLPGDVLF